MTTPLTDSEIQAALERAEAVTRSRVLPDKPYSYPEELTRLQNLAEFNRGSAVTMAALCRDLLAARKRIETLEFVLKFTLAQMEKDHERTRGCWCGELARVDQPCTICEIRQALDGGNIYPSAQVIIGKRKP